MMCNALPVYSSKRRNGIPFLTNETVTSPANIESHPFVKMAIRHRFSGALRSGNAAQCGHVPL